MRALSKRTRWTKKANFIIISGLTKPVNETNTETKMHKRQTHFGVDKLIAVFSVLLITVINGQSHETQPYQYSINGFRSDLIRFPEDTPTPAARFLDYGSGGGSGDGSYGGYQSPKRDTSRIIQRSNEVSLSIDSCLSFVQRSRLHGDSLNSFNS